MSIPKFRTLRLIVMELSTEVPTQSYLSSEEDNCFPNDILAAFATTQFKML
jgi:hypothetical protein